VKRAIRAGSRWHLNSISCWIVIVATIPILATASLATVIDTNSLILVASVATRGQYDNAQLTTWNGQPLSSTNHPTFDEDQLSAIWDFYVDPAAPNTLYIVATNVYDTQFGFIFGAPFDLVALTGFEFSLPIQTSSYAQFSNQFAIPGEALLGPVAGTSLLLDTTPGWNLISVSGLPNEATYSIEASSVNDAFTHFSSVFGETRIYGGGVFQLTFAPKVNFLDTDFAALTVTASNGMGAYVETPAPTSCSATYNGTFNGNLNITSGVICIINGTVIGNVIQSGGQLLTSNGTIKGNLQIIDGTFLIAGTTIHGNVQVQNISGGSAQDEMCHSNVTGNLQLQDNAAAIAIGTRSGLCPGNTIGKNFEVSDNTAATQIFRDTVGGSLECQNNLAITGGGVTAKSTQGQCAGFVGGTPVGQSLRSNSASNGGGGSSSSGGSTSGGFSGGETNQ
jgi:uncharacterized membrane protein YgcG